MSKELKQILKSKFVQFKSELTVLFRMSVCVLSKENILQTLFFPVSICTVYIKHIIVIKIYCSEGL
jgi:hypothetical protein